MPYTNKALRPQGDAVLVTGGKKKDASINDVHLLDSGRRPIERRLSSIGFRCQVDVLLNNGIQRFQPLEEGQRLSVLACLVVAYVDDFLIDVDVSVDGFLHGKALRGERGRRASVHGQGGAAWTATYSDFRGQVDVPLNNGVQRFQPLEEGQRLSILACLVVAYVDDFLVNVDVQVDGFLHGEVLRGERGLEVHILRRDLRHLQGHQGLKEFVTM